MIKTGVVLETNKTSIFIMTRESEFLKLKTKSGKAPHIGEIYTGELYKKDKPLYKLILLLVIISLITYIGINIINKITPAYSVVVEINSSIQLKVNRSNDIIAVEPMNSKGVDLVKDMELNHKSLDNALTILLEKADTLNYLKDFYSKKENPIRIYLTEHDNISIPLSSFKNKAAELKISLIINDNGE
jgi:hypothetical protein